MEQVNNLDSLYALYREEFEDVYTVFIPNIGFANYKFEPDGIYVQEVFVSRNMRGLKYAATLTSMCIEDAERRFNSNVKKVYTTLAIGGNTIDLSIRAITAYGFKILKADKTMIYFYKELNHE
jgi:GNAT superfamily N-acetyltransferase